MLRRGLLAPAALAAMVGLGIGMVPASAAPAPQLDNFQKLRVAKHKGGPYDQELRINLGSGDTKTLFLRVNNTGPAAADLRLVESGPVGGYQPKYFYKGNNVTQRVLNNEYTFTLGSGKARKLTLKVKRPSLAAPTGCVVPTLELQTGANLNTANVQINHDTACT